MYEVYALKCGERDTTACEFFYREPSHDRVTLDFFVWLILGGPHPVLVDTGFAEEDAAQRADPRLHEPGGHGPAPGRPAGGRRHRAGVAPPLGPLGGARPVPVGGVLDPAGGGGLLDRPHGALRRLQGSGQPRGAGPAGDAELRQPPPAGRGGP